MKKLLEPHPGPQTTFLETEADIALYGGQAGGGKSWALIAEASRNIADPNYGAVIFRRTSPQITNEGGLWDESSRLFPHLGGVPNQASLDWRFRSGANIGFRHLQYETSKLAWAGAQIAMIGWDELTHFTESQFWFLGARNRSTCGVPPYVRATTNPVPADDPVGGWVNRLVSWWINQETGFAIPERSGVLRWFIRRQNELIWADSSKELYEKYRIPNLSDDHEDQPRPKSFTFISAKLSDNPTLMRLNPEYRANLLALPEVEKQRLADGNWNAKLQAGLFFKVGQLKPWPSTELPASGWRFCRAWDLAATDGAGDWTVGAKIGAGPDGQFIIADIVRGQWESNYRDKMIKQVTAADGVGCSIWIPQDPGAAGKSEASRIVGMLATHTVTKETETGDKATRATGFSSQVNAGNVWIMPAAWNHGLTQRMDAFPTKGVPDDEIDAMAHAFVQVSTTIDLGAWLEKGAF